MVRVKLVSSDKIVHKSWANRRKYSRRSRLARQRHQQSVATSLNKAGSPNQVAETSWCISPENKSTQEQEKATNSLSYMEEDANFSSFIAECESIMEENILMEKDTTPCPPRFPIDGRRIVDMQYMLNWVVDMQFDHSKICTGGKLGLLKEIRTGLTSTLIFCCNICHREYRHRTTDPKRKPNICQAAVWGTLASGTSFAHTEEIFSVLEIPFLIPRNFRKIQMELHKHWQDFLWFDMEKAGFEEKAEALKNNQVSPDGSPWITVMVDGGWSKRSYGHNFNAKSGVAVIIGHFTKKILFLGVRNKYCCICARSESKGEIPSAHSCFKNWSSSSTAMEADIVVEGFRSSETMHGLKYLQFIGDGDSSVFSKIRERVIYGKDVTKVECKNHVIKNYQKALYTLAGNSNLPSRARNLLNPKAIKRLLAAAKGAIKYNSQQGTVQSLQMDFKNAPFHVFGNHLNCRSYYCTKVDGSATISDQTTINLETKKEVDQTEFLQVCGFWDHIIECGAQLVRKAGRVLANETNNRCENYMNIVSRFTSGKRLNLISRENFQTRCYLAGLRYNRGVEWHNPSWKRAFETSPGKVTKRFISAKHKQNINRRVRRTLFPVQKKRVQKENNPPDQHYGPNADDVELEENELQSACLEKLAEFKKLTKQEQDEIANTTVGQFNNPIYIEKKRNLLTASNFGTIIKRRSTTPCHNHVKSILFPAIFKETRDMQYGKINEKVAIQEFTRKTGIHVTESGLYIDLDNSYLGASPDGLVGDTGLVEVKCVSALNRKNVTLFEAAEQQKNFMLEIYQGNLRLKRTHNYFYQIQGQLNILKRNKCYFIVFTNVETDIFIEEILVDSDLWNNKMLPSLKIFYKECVLVELVLQRIPKGKTCKDPPEILQAIENNKNKTKI